MSRISQHSCCVWRGKGGTHGRASLPWLLPLLANIPQSGSTYKKITYKKNTKYPPKANNEKQSENEHKTHLHGFGHSITRNTIVKQICRGWLRNVPLRTGGDKGGNQGHSVLSWLLSFKSYLRRFTPCKYNILQNTNT